MQATWSITYKGIGVAILQLSDGTYQGVTERGYSTVPYPTTAQALADLKSHIDAQGGH
jgi:hypothetical protein